MTITYGEPFTDSASETTYTPFFTDQGQVGLRCVRGDTTRWLTLNASMNDVPEAEDDEDDANVFLYLDEDSDNPPTLVNAKHYYLIWEDE